MAGTAAVMITMADDGVTAIEQVKLMKETGGSFDAIFMDNNMVHMNGHEAARAIRASGYTSLIVGVTGNVTKEDTDQFLSAGANEVLAKPVRRAELAAILAKLVLSKSREV